MNLLLVEYSYFQLGPVLTLNPNCLSQYLTQNDQVTMGINDVAASMTSFNKQPIF